MTARSVARRNRPVRVLAYMRVSKQEEVTGSFTFETQRLRIKEKLDQHYGVDHYTLETLLDNGVSGGYGARPTGVERRTRPTMEIVEEKLKSR